MSDKPKNLKAGRLLQIAWLIANAEAKNLGATEILPVHFLLAVLKVVDPAFPEMLDTPTLKTGEWTAMCREADEIRHYIEILPDRVTRKRRLLRARLAKDQVRPPIAVEGMLHRSEDVKRAFLTAGMSTDDGTLTLRQLVESLFALELVSLTDVDAQG